MRSTPCRSSPIVTTDRYRSTASRLVSAKKARTPELALSPLRISLMTSVSTRYISTPFVGLLASEITLLADIGNRCKNVRQVSPLRTPQYRLEDFAMLLLCAAIAFRSPLLKCFDQIFRQVTYYKLCHRSLLRLRTSKIIPLYSPDASIDSSRLKGLGLTV